MAVVGAAVALVLVVALVRPGYAFVLALLLFCAEGSIKALLTADGVPFSTPTAMGAASIDFALLAAVGGLIASDRGESLRRTWEGTATLGRLGVVLLACWLLLSVAQIFQSGDVNQGVQGFRLTQAYVAVALAGATLLARDRHSNLFALVSALAIVSAYAGVRALVGPSDFEREYALSREGVTEFELGEIFRTVGSFSGAVGLASFAVPATVFAFGIFLRLPRYRLPAGLCLLGALVAIAGTYGRSAAVAAGAGMLLSAVLLRFFFPAGVRATALTFGAAAASIAALVLGVAIASSLASETRSRAKGIVDPGEDPSLSIRLQTWRETLERVDDHPFGSGLGTVGHASSRGGRTITTDSSYLKILREQGIPGLALFVAGLGALCIAVLAGLQRAPPERRAFGVAALAGFVSFLALAATAEYVEQPGKVLAWTLLGISVWSAFRAPEAA
jgi:O-Antigen ligase